MAPDESAAVAERDETPAERIDRNWGELLQEVRVTQTGLQILAGFLLTLPFQSSFDRLSHTQRLWYAETLAAALTATAFMLMPVITHRIVFRHHAKARLLRVSDTAAKIGLGLLGVTLVSALGLVCDLVFGRGVALVAGGIATLVLLLLWLAVPLAVRGRGRDSYAGGDDR